MTTQKKSILPFIIPVFLILSVSLISLSLQTTQQAAENTSIYYGNYVPNGFQIGTNLATIEADGGKGLAIIPWYLNWTSGFPTNTMSAIRGHGSIPELTWQPDSGGIKPAYSLSNIINGTYDNYITQFAQAAKAWGHPFFLRFAHEMNGTWYGWSEQVNGNSKGQYVQMWKHVHDIFTANGATNVTWVWCPNVGSIAGLYPGDSYVDWTCMDGYNWGTSQSWGKWQSFSQIFQSTYQAVLSVAPSKPIMIGETASAEQGGDKASWITDVLTLQLPNNFPQVKAFLWFNEANTPWRIETSPASQQAFAKGLSSSYYVGNQFGSISTSPIPPPSSQTTAPTTTPPSVPAGSTIFSGTLCPHGLGNCGDNVNPQGGGNTNPLHVSRNVTVTVLDNSATPIASQQAVVSYNQSSQNFQGTVAIPNVPPGTYVIKVKMDGFLSKQIPGIITVSPGQTITLPSVSLITGDINNDDQLDILDYNILIGCFGSKQNTPSCTMPPTSSSSGADINDDGVVDGIDYNLFVRELSVQQGAGGNPSPTQSPSPTVSPPPVAGLLPGEKLWKNGVSSYLFGTNNTNNWSNNNIETNTTAQQLLTIAGIPLIRTWFFSPNGYGGNLGTDQETDKRLQVDQTIGANCLGVLQDIQSRSFQYYQHLVAYVGNRCLIYEFGNEPGVGSQPGMSQYIQDWIAEIPTFRKLNPNAKFGGPVNGVSDVQTFLNGVKQSGVLPDFVTIHEYSSDPTLFGKEITQVKQIVQNELGHQLPVGITEFNYNCCGSFDPNAPSMTQYWTTVYNGLIAAHADFATEFDSFNHGGINDNDLDMFDSNTQPRTIYTMLKTFINQYKQ